VVCQKFHLENMLRGGCWLFIQHETLLNLAEAQLNSPRCVLQTILSRLKLHPCKAIFVSHLTERIF